MIRKSARPAAMPLTALTGGAASRSGGTRSVPGPEKKCNLWPVERVQDKNLSNDSMDTGERMPNQTPPPPAPPPARRGRVVMVVGNFVDGDARVQKEARAAAAAGWETFLVGRSPLGVREEYALGGATVIRAAEVMTATRYRSSHPRRGLSGVVAYRSREVSRMKHRRQRMRQGNVAVERERLDRRLASAPVNPVLASGLRMDRAFRATLIRGLGYWVALRKQSFDRNTARSAADPNGGLRVLLARVGGSSRTWGAQPRPVDSRTPSAPSSTSWSRISCTPTTRTRWASRRGRWTGTCGDRPTRCAAHTTHPAACTRSRTTRGPASRSARASTAGPRPGRPPIQPELQHGNLGRIQRAPVSARPLRQQRSDVAPAPGPGQSSTDLRVTRSRSAIAFDSLPASATPQALRTRSAISGRATNPALLYAATPPTLELGVHTRTLDDPISRSAAAPASVIARP